MPSASTSTDAAPLAAVGIITMTTTLSKTKSMASQSLSSRTDMEAAHTSHHPRRVARSHRQHKEEEEEDHQQQQQQQHKSTSFSHYHTLLEALDEHLWHVHECLQDQHRRYMYPRIFASPPRIPAKDDPEGNSDELLSGPRSVGMVVGVPMVAASVVVQGDEQGPSSSVSNSTSFLLKDSNSDALVDDPPVVVELSRLALYALRQTLREVKDALLEGARGGIGGEEQKAAAIAEVIDKEEQKVTGVSPSSKSRPPAIRTLGDALTHVTRLTTPHTLAHTPHIAHHRIDTESEGRDTNEGKSLPTPGALPVAANSTLSWQQRREAEAAAAARRRALLAETLRQDVRRTFFGTPSTTVTPSYLSAGEEGRHVLRQLVALRLGLAELLGAEGRTQQRLREAAEGLVAVCRGPLRNGGTSNPLQPSSSSSMSSTAAAGNVPPAAAAAFALHHLPGDLFEVRCGAEVPEAVLPPNEAAIAAIAGMTAAWRDVALLAAELRNALTSAAVIEAATATATTIPTLPTGAEGVTGNTTATMILQTVLNGVRAIIAPATVAAAADYATELGGPHGQVPVATQRVLLADATTHAAIIAPCPNLTEAGGDAPATTAEVAHLLALAGVLRSREARLLATRAMRADILQCVQCLGRVPGHFAGDDDDDGGAARRGQEGGVPSSLQVGGEQAWIAALRDVLQQVRLYELIAAAPLCPPAHIARYYAYACGHLQRRKSEAEARQDDGANNCLATIPTAPQGLGWAEEDVTVVGFGQCLSDILDLLARL